MGDRVRRAVTVVAVVAGVSVALTGCSSGGSPTAAAAGRSAPPRGPVATVAPLTGGTGIYLASGAKLPTLPADWVQAEYSLSGTAVSYSAPQGMPSDGKFHLVAGTSAPYTTRIVVRRPAKPADFNGTVVVEWLNVSGGVDAAPDYTYMADELIRGGYAWVGVSAQYIGVMGGPVAVSTPVSALGGAGKGLVNLDPARYGSLHHPGDAYAYDIYTQTARTLRHPKGVDPLGDLTPKRILGVGESQSAFMLTTYVDGVQPLAHAYDGFLLHSRGAAAAPLGQPGQGIGITQALSGPPARIRTDTGVPVIMVETETDVLGVIGYYPARQPDTDRIRTWEVAGTSHVDATQLGATAAYFGCSAPVNDGPDNFVVASALRHLASWSAGGRPPPVAPRFEVADGKYVRDADGIVVGGIRTPLVDVPVDVLSGEPSPGGGVACILAGSTTPLPASTLAAKYPSRADYLARYRTSTDKVIAQGFVLAQDRAALLAKAQPERIPA